MKKLTDVARTISYMNSPGLSSIELNSLFTGLAALLASLQCIDAPNTIAGCQDDCGAADAHWCAYLSNFISYHRSRGVCYYYSLEESSNFKRTTGRDYCKNCYRFSLLEHTRLRRLLGVDCLLDADLTKFTTRESQNELFSAAYLDIIASGKQRRPLSVRHGFVIGDDPGSWRV